MVMCCSVEYRLSRTILWTILYHAVNPYLVESFATLSSSSQTRSCAWSRHFLANDVFTTPIGDDMSSSYSTEDSAVAAPIGLYIHIPYCRRRCRYCNFAIVPIGPSVSPEDIIQDNKSDRGFQKMNQQYLGALLTEIKKTQSLGSKISLQSIYFGGGTPSLAPLDTIERILQAILDDPDSCFELTHGAEVTMEMDPGTFTTEKLLRLKDCGVNRVSLGVQSFDNQLLETMGRIHREADIYDAIESLHEAFGDTVNYSIDLISGLPGLSLAKWSETLSIATNNLHPSPSHISIYDLQVERGTVFGKWYPEVDVDSTSMTSLSSSMILPSEEDCAFMYKFASGYLQTKGFEHYEVSSYAKPNSRSRHNQIYWNTDGQWHAFGLGSTSFVNGVSTARPREMADYLDWVRSDPNEGSHDHEKQPEDEYLTDVIMKRLRTSDGLDLNWLSSRFGDATKRQVMKGAVLGLDLKLAEVIVTENELGPSTEILRLVDPGGFLFSNYIISNIFVELDSDVE